MIQITGAYGNGNEKFVYLFFFFFLFWFQKEYSQCKQGLLKCAIFMLLSYHFIFSDPNTWIFASLMISFLINLRQTSLRQSQVFQLDPLREDVSDIPVTARQRVLSGAITEGITNILNGPELDSAVRDCQLEITQVKNTVD